MKVFIDGENCRRGFLRILVAEKIIKKVDEMSSYQLRALLQDILAEIEPNIFYYTSQIRLPQGYIPKQETLQRVQEINIFNRLWGSNLIKQDITTIKAGYLKVKTSDPCPSCKKTYEVLQEKGVDVRLASDIIEEAYAQKRSTYALFSSDTDLCPAIHKAKKLGATIIYIAFADRVNRAVSAAASQTITIPLPKVCQYNTFVKEEIA